jgi:hypothetical protein
VKLDATFPNLMRSVFQAQPEVGHVYLGSKRHVLDRIFNDKNEPFWRSAKRLEIGVIARAEFGAFVKRRFDDTDKGITDGALVRLLDATGGHPYATQELAYSTWELVPTGHYAHDGDVEAALTKVIRAEHNNFARIWEHASEQQRLLMLALAREPASVYSVDYQARYGLASSSHVQRALSTLVKEEVAGRNEAGEYCIVEPFLAEWLNRGQDRSPAVRELRGADG